MPGFMAEVGMPYWIDLVTSEPRKSANFYEQVLGWEVTPASDEYQVGRVQGLPIGGFIPQPDDAAAPDVAPATMPDTWVTYFLSCDLADDCARVEKLGGRVLSQPREVERGQMALLVDPAGAMFGLIEPPKGEQFVAGGEPGCPVWHELAATGKFAECVDFYGELFNWQIHAAGGGNFENIEYATAEADGAAFAGLWNARGAFPEHVPGFWQTYLGVRDIDAAAAKAEELGGEIIRPPWNSPFGRLCLLADSTGATVTLAEVADAPEEEPREADDVLGL